MNPDEVVLADLKGLVFLPSVRALQAGGRAVRGIDASAVSTIDTAEFRRTMEGFLGREVTLAHLEEIRALTVEFFRAYDRPFVDVIVPVQEIEGDTIQIVALEFRAGQVNVRGNRHFSTEALQRDVRLVPGGAISGSTVIEDVDWLNQNPFRRVTTAFEPGEAEGETDVTYEVQDREPWRLYSVVQNNGSRATGRARLALGVQWGDVFGWGHQASYQATIGADISRFSAHAATYRIPLPWRDNLLLSGSLSRTDPELSNNFTQVAESHQASIRYQWRLPRLEALSHRIEFGPDYKRATSNLNFFGAPVLTGVTEIVQFAAGYFAERPDAWGATSGGITLFHSPGGLTGANDSADFRPAATRSGRQFADANYTYGQAHVERTQNLPMDFSLFGRVGGQLTNANLLSSEQFGLGGAAGVRGYDERAVNGDYGLATTLELRSPEMSLMGAGAGQMRDRFQALLFWDYGFAGLHERAAGEPNVTYLSGVGAGIRYGLGSNLSLAADLGFPLRDVPGGENRTAWLHFSLMLAL